MKKILETYRFTNAKELRDWLSHVQGEADLSTVYIYNRYPVEGRRTDTGAELGVHGHDYKPVPPKYMIDLTRNILERSDLCLDNLVERIDTSHDGARTFVQYRLPEHTYETVGGDTASLGLLSISSADGTWPFMISAAATQFACTNLQVFITGDVAFYKAKHTQSLNIEHGGRVITASLKVFERERELWEEWSGLKATNDTAFRVFANALKCTKALELSHEGHTPMQILNDGLPRHNLNLEYIWNKYSSVYKRRLGANYWAVFNAMTDWSTHAKPTRKKSLLNLAAVRNNNHEVVRAAVRSSNFLKEAA